MDSLPAMALADEFDGFLVDLDGVVWLGREMIPGSVETLARLLERGKELVFVTNNPGKPASAYVERLRQAGLDVPDGCVVTAGTATAELAAERVGAGTPAFVIGAPAFEESVAAAGLEVLAGEAGREAAAVLVAGHRGFDYEELLTATRALQGGAKLFATSRDPTMPMPGGAWPGTGAVLAAVETASGARAEIGGKPERPLFEAARSLIAGRAVAMIGDRVNSDIVGGRRAGLVTILVLSGSTTAEEAAVAEPRPDHMLDELRGLL